MSRIDAGPIDTDFYDIPAGTDFVAEVKIVPDGSDLDISGDTFEAVVRAHGTYYPATTLIVGGSVRIGWTGTQTEAMGPGCHMWRFTRTVDEVTTDTNSGKFKVTPRV